MRPTYEPADVRLIYELLPELRHEKGWSVEKLSQHTDAPRHVGEATIDTYEDPRNAGRMPEAEIIEALANAFGVAPSVFYEWPRAVAVRNRAVNKEEADAARQRVRDRLRAKARRESEHPQAAPHTTPLPPYPQGQAL